MSKLTKDEARIAATHLAYLACGIHKWIEGCTPFEQQRRLNFVVDMLTPDDMPKAPTQTFQEWSDTFFAGNGQEIPAHILSSYQLAYDAGYAAGAAS